MHSGVLRVSYTQGFVEVLCCHVSHQELLKSSPVARSIQLAHSWKQNFDRHLFLPIEVPANQESCRQFTAAFPTRSETTVEYLRSTCSPISSFLVMDVSQFRTAGHEAIERSDYINRRTRLTRLMRSSRIPLREPSPATSQIYSIAWLPSFETSWYSARYGGGMAHHRARPDRYH